MVTVIVGDGEITLTWDEISGATAYGVYYYTNGKYYKQTVTAETSFTIGNLVNGVEYEFLVQSYVDGAWSAFTTADHVTATPTA